MVRYEVQIQPVRLTCNGCAANRDYVVAYEKKNVVEFATQPQPCLGNGEVNFCRPTDPITVAPFMLLFDTGKERREVEFAIYDFTNRPRSVERVIAFRVAVGHQVDVAQKETFCGVRDFPFREGRMNGTLRVLLRMHPVGTAAPSIGSGSSQTQASRVDTAKFSKEVLAQLHQEGLVPPNITQLQVDADIFAEIQTKLQVLRTAAKVQEKLNPKKQALWARMTELQAELDALEAEHRNATSSLDAADARVYSLLQGEAQKWRSLLGGDSQGDEASRQAADASTLLLHEDLEQQKAALEKKLQFLESQHAPMSDVMESLSELQHVQALLDDVKQQSPHLAAAGKAVGGQRRGVHFQPTDPETVRLVDALFDALSEGEQLDYAIRVGGHMQRQLYDGVDKQLEDHQTLFSIPNEFSFLAHPKYNVQHPTPSSSSSTGESSHQNNVAPVEQRQPPSAKPAQATAVAPTNHTNSKDFFNDLFAAPAPTPAPAAHPTTPAPIATAAPNGNRQKAATSIDDLFGSPIAPPRPAAAPTFAPASNGVTTSSLSSTAPQGGHLERLPVQTTSEFVSLFQHRLLRVKATAFQMATPARTMRVSELTFQNGGKDRVVIRNVQVVQEDFFTSNETEVPCHMGAPQIEVPPGEFKNLMLSFGPTVSMKDSLMVLMKLQVEEGANPASTDTVRITL